MKKTYLTLAMSALLILTGAGPAHAQKKGGDVVIAMTGAPPSLDPHATSAQVARNVNLHIFETLYARDDAHKAELLKKEFHANAKVEVGRFKGLGEMMASQLKETTMDRRKRTLLRVTLQADDREDTADAVERLMGTKAESRFAFIQEKAEFAREDLLDV